MTRWHSLSDRDTGVAIFTDDALKDIRKLDASDGKDALTAIINCLSNAAPESVIEKDYETCRALQQLRQGDMRLYVMLHTHLPDYNILWVFAARKHEYRNIGKFDAQACAKLQILKQNSTVDEVEQYIEANDALTASDLRELHDKL
ncbi:hypothetical protein [Haloarchaeobius baliensis]|uniref:hypothetical protein n=1 Tax=Haloarchaeobius baliensis TaxID=1670458 RepID=UPI003F885A2F